MNGEIVRTIPSPSGRFRACVIRTTVGALRVEVERWTEEWVPGYGKVAEFWELATVGTTYADTIERAEELAHEALRTWGD